ncbi:hypothetical protein Tco_1237992 [Tanacetum coccineum]
MKRMIKKLMNLKVISFLFVGPQGIGRPTDRMCLYIDAEEHELGDLGEPANYKAALLDPESDKWLTAMNVEMQSMKDNEVWILVELPPNGKVRLYSKPQGLDYEEPSHLLQTLEY